VTNMTSQSTTNASRDADYRCTQCNHPSEDAVECTIACHDYTRDVLAMQLDAMIDCWELEAALNSAVSIRRYL